ncbi:MAG: hypothetical protein EPN36_03210 [Rhodanobacteraceae bacterium]|nr:MAG: hypothetical protein EPN36_03210 [Rhodanobacteraceae bacterium]
MKIGAAWWVTKKGESRGGGQEPMPPATGFATPYNAKSKRARDPPAGARWNAADRTGSRTPEATNDEFPINAWAQ